MLLIHLTSLTLIFLGQKFSLILLRREVSRFPTPKMKSLPSSPLNSLLTFPVVAFTFTVLSSFP